MTKIREAIKDAAMGSTGIVQTYPMFLEMHKKIVKQPAKTGIRKVSEEEQAEVVKEAKEETKRIR